MVKMLVYIQCISFLLGGVSLVQGQTCPGEIGWAVQNRVQTGYSTTVQAWITTIPFPCDGIITHWQYWAGRSTPWKGIVFRAVDNRYSEVQGINNIPAGATNQKVIYEVPERERIFVNKGDLLGFAWNGPAPKHDIPRDGANDLQDAWLFEKYYTYIVGSKFDKTLAKIRQRSYSIKAVMSANDEVADQDLRGLSDVNVTSDNVLEVASNLSNLVGKQDQISNDNLHNINSILNDVVDIGDPSVNVTKHVVETVNSVMGSYVTDDVVPEANLIQRAVDTQISNLQKGPGNATIKASNLAIEAIKIPTNSIISGKIAFQAKSGSNNEVFYTTVKTIKPKTTVQLGDSMDASISFQLSNKTFTDIYGNQNISFIVYKDATLFPSTLLTKTKSAVNNTKREVASLIISATVEGTKITQRNLPKNTPVELEFVLNQAHENVINDINDAQCVFWNTSASNGLGDWSAEGCLRNKTSSDGRITCNCNHLTSFAVIVDIHGKSSLVLDFVSKIGCGLSILCLLVTIVTYLSQRKLRRVKPKQILINFSFSLLCLYVVFVFGIERGSKSDIGCITVSVLLHYFTMTSVAWMAVEAFHMYVLFVIVVGYWANIPRFLMKASLLAWGLPVLIVSVILGVNANEYNNTKHCFLKLSYAFYFNLLVIALVIGVNMVIFGLIMHRLTYGRVRLNREKQNEWRKRVYNAIAISILMGLTWIFGLFSLINKESSLFFQYFFGILNSLQGAFIFILFCVRQQEVVEVWKEKIKMICGKNDQPKNQENNNGM